MAEYSEAYVAFDTSTTKHAVAIADGGRRGEVRFLGDVASSPARVERLTRKLAERYRRLKRSTPGPVQPTLDDQRRPPYRSHSFFSLTGLSERRYRARAISCRLRRS